MELRSGIELPCREGRDIPVNSSCIELKSANVGCDSLGYLDLLKGLGKSEAAPVAETMSCSINDFEIWNQFPASSYINAAVRSGLMGPSTPFVFTAGSGNGLEASHPYPEMRGHQYEIPQSVSQDVDSEYWAKYVASCSSQLRRDVANREALNRFSPITPNKNKSVVESMNNDNNESDLDRANKRIRQEINVFSVARNKPVEMGFIQRTFDPASMLSGGMSPSMGTWIRENANVQIAERNMVSQDSSIPSTPTKWKTPPVDCVGKDDALYCHEMTESNIQMENGNVERRSESICPLQQESQTQVVEGTLDHGQQNTPQQKARRKKHRPKVVNENKPARQRKPRPVDTPDVPRVKRKYVRKAKTGQPETVASAEGEGTGNKNMQPAAKRVLDFDADESKKESVPKDQDVGSTCKEDAQYKPSNDCYAPFVSGNLDPQNQPSGECNVQCASANGSVGDCNIQCASANGSVGDCNVQCASANGSVGDCNVQCANGSTGMRYTSVKFVCRGGRPNDQVPEQCRPRIHFIQTSQPYRRHVLRENMKALARDKHNIQNQGRTDGLIAQGFSFSPPATPEISKKKRSRRDSNSSLAEQKGRNINPWAGFGQVTGSHAYNGIYTHPGLFISEQCKRKRTKAGRAENAPNSVSSSETLVSDQQPSSEDSLRILACMSSQQLSASNQSQVNSSCVTSSQVQNHSLIAQANAMCASQLPFPPQASISYYRNLSLVVSSNASELTPPKVPRKRTKNEQLREANGMHFSSPAKNIHLGSSHAINHPTTFSRTSILEVVDFLIQKLACLNINAIHGDGEVPCSSLQQENALVPYNGGGAMVPFDSLSGIPKKRKPRAKVDLDAETNRVWLLLMGSVRIEAPEGTDAEKEKWWEEERRVFQGRADSFIARMHLVQGDRRFSPWKGSVVDSVVGVFLTQNVSDHLSSSAYMNLAARFPIRINVRCKEVKVNAEGTDVYLVEFDEYVKEHEEVSRHPVIAIDLAVLTPEAPQNIEEKDISQDAESHEEEIINGMIVCSDSPAKSIHIIHQMRENINMEESEYSKSFENTLIDLNSIASSQNSSDSPVEAQNTTGMGLQSHFGMLDEKNSHCFGAPSTFMELFQLADESRLHLLPKEPTIDVRCSQEILDGGKKDAMIHSIDKTEVTCQSGNKCCLNVCHDGNGFAGLPCNSFSFHNPHPCDYGKAAVEDTGVSRDRESNSFGNTSGITNKCCSENSFIIPSVNNVNQATDLEKSVSTSHNTSLCDPHAKLSNPVDGCQGQVYCDQLSSNENSPPVQSPNQIGNQSMQWSGCVAKPSQNHMRKDSQGMNMNSSTAASTQTTQSCPLILPDHACPLQNNSDGKKSLCEIRTIEDAPGITKSKLQDEKVPTEITNAGKPRKKRVEKAASEPIDWDLLRRTYGCGEKKERSREAMDSIDWEAIRRADVSEVSDAIRERGMNNRLAERIKEFLDRLVKDHGSIDLEWLRDVPPDKVKDYLLSIKGLGLKSVECVRLLTLHHLAFPVDTNVGRICVRLGWVPIQPLPESLQLHLLELYPMLETIQKYLWPRLCKLDQRTLYELHYQMITFGKVFCTKSKPNCNACPMRGECKHFASAFASARLALPGPEEKGLVSSTVPVTRMPEPQPNIKLLPLPQSEGNPLPEESVQNNCEPIIEEPATPEPENLEVQLTDLEDFCFDDPDEIPTIKLNIDKFTENLQNIMQGNNMMIQEEDITKALVATSGAASIPQPKLKNISRLRTEHQVYVLPDSHPLLEGLDKREPDDPCPYLLAIWSPGETAQSMELPVASCSSQETGILCVEETCPTCNSIRESRAQIVRGTFLIPCRTAMRGSFPLNGTYFQVNEVFADHKTSLDPMDIPRQLIWNLPRRTVYFGTSVPTIFRGQSTEAIQQCFWRGFVCVRGFERESRAPRPLMARLHFPASKAPKNKKAATK